VLVFIIRIATHTLLQTCSYILDKFVYALTCARATYRIQLHTVHAAVLADLTALADQHPAIVK